MDLKDGLMILATLLSPLVALQVSVYLQDRREKRERRFRVFQVLMTTRAASLAPEHVEALNSIDIAFYGADPTSRAVLEAHKVYLDHLNQPTLIEGWGPRREELLVELLQKMAVSLRYDFDKVTLRRASYFPRGFGDRDWEAQQIRQLLLALLKGERWLPVLAVAPPTQKQSSPPDARSVPASGAEGQSSIVAPPSHEAR
jgi:hypothetical protein